ncbi:MAG: DNA polymerase III subunit gamma/tau [Pseudomonadota bacterium]
MTQALARKWRPRSFAEMVGQEHAVRALANALGQQRLHHAYLFTGTRGVGKTTLARVFAKALNCETGVTAEPCGQCGACREIDTGRFVDLVELDAASNTQVDNMRELLDNAMYAPTAGRFKVYIIDEVHMLSRSAFNAMLKTLEEPPEHVKFVLATTDPQKVPVTVLSRCLQFNLKQIPAPLIAERLKAVLAAEGIAGEEAALAMLARAAQGSLRDALSLLDQAIAHGGGTVAAGAVREMLGSVEREYLFGVLHALRRGDGPGLVRIAADMEARSLSFDAALQELAALLTQVATAQVAAAAVPDDLPDRSEVLEAAQALGPDDVQLYYQIVVNGRRDLDLAPDEFAGFAMTLLRMLAFAPGGGSEPRRLQSPPSRAAGTADAAPAPAGAADAGAGSREADAAPVLREPAPLDWHSLVGTLGLAGMAKQLAAHSELLRVDGNRYVFGLPEAHRHLLDKVYQERIAAALSGHVGRPVRVEFTLGGGTGNSPAELQSRAAGERQARAIEAIESDPFVRDLIENFDARLNDSSIRPRD